MSTRLPDPDTLERLVRELWSDLQKSGYPQAARRLSSVQDTGYTTSTEWLGELAQAAREIRRQHTHLPAPLRDRLKQLTEWDPAAGILMRRAILIAAVVGGFLFLRWLIN